MGTLKSLLGVVALVTLSACGTNSTVPDTNPVVMPADADGDGVADSRDSCADTPSNVTVDGRGCALDSDGDGVANYADRCADTPSGADVDDWGCTD